LDSGRTVGVLEAGLENFVSHIDAEGQSDKLSWSRRLYARPILKEKRRVLPRAVHSKRSLIAS